MTSCLWALICLSLIGQMSSCITMVLAFETFPARVFEAAEQTVSISTHTPDDPDAQESTLVDEEMHAYEITSIRTCQLDHNYYRYQCGKWGLTLNPDLRAGKMVLPYNMPGIDYPGSLGNLPFCIASTRYLRYRQPSSHLRMANRAAVSYRH